jgi:hypothetical protein
MSVFRKVFALIRTAFVGAQLRETVNRHQSAADRLDAAVKEVLKQ